MIKYFVVKNSLFQNLSAQIIEESWIQKLISACKGQRGRFGISCQAIYKPTGRCSETLTQENYNLLLIIAISFCRFINLDYTVRPEIMQQPIFIKHQITPTTNLCGDPLNGFQHI